MKKVKMVWVLPTLLTLGNAICGFGAITFAAKWPTSLEGTELVHTNIGGRFGNELFVAAILIFLGMVFDMLDGRAARWAKHTTDFGAQLDSLCDAITFGVAPAFLMLQFVRYEHSLGAVAPIFEYPPRLLWVIAALFVVCVLLRLARFNVETDDDDTHEEFSGLPSPAAAGTVASFPLAMYGLNNLAGDSDAVGQHIAAWLIPAIKIALPLITLAVACLMVSRVRYPHVFNQLFRGRRSRQHLIQLVFTVAVISQVHEMAVPLIFGYFAFASPLRAAWKEVVARRLYKPRGI